MPWPLNREAGIAAYEEALSPDQYRERLASGATTSLVGKARPLDLEPPVLVAKIGQRWQSSADGKIDLFEIVPRDGRPLPRFEAGAHVDVTVTPQYIRQFSLAGDPEDRFRYLLGILREDRGRGWSLKIHQMLQTGAPVIVSTPRNHFPIASGHGRHLLLAGGIGVTPLIAMAHTLWRQKRPFELYYKARTRAQAAFIPELVAMPWSQHVHFHFSDENRLEVRTVLENPGLSDHLYTCGPAAFMDTVFDTAKAFGWPEEAMHREYFAVPEEGAWENHDFEIEIAATGQIIPVPRELKATQALEQAGITVDVKCSDGLCGVCSTRYLAGEVEHRDYVLSRAQRQERMIVCCSRARQPGGRITLDL
jgi:ferredoxin-NADP reductase